MTLTPTHRRLITDHFLTFHYNNYSFSCAVRLCGLRNSSPIRVTKRWARSWSQCTGSQPTGDFQSHLSGSRLPLLSARPAVTFPAEERHHPSTNTKLYCLLTEAYRCEQMPKVITELCPGGNWTHDLLIASTTPCGYATAPLRNSSQYVLIHAKNIWLRLRIVTFSLWHQVDHNMASEQLLQHQLTCLCLLSAPSSSTANTHYNYS